MRRGLSRWAFDLQRAALDLFFPPRCAFCDEETDTPADGILLCAECRGRMVHGSGEPCPRCGARTTECRRSALGCPSCTSILNPVDGVVPLGPYEDSLREAVLRMKRRSSESLSMAVGRLYAQCRGEALARAKCDLIVPVPMHWLRRLVRGTNSPETVAQGLAAALDRPVAPRMVVRCRNTLPQSELLPGERQKNVRGAFRVRAGYPLMEKRVLLVDDILTTGATCSEIAKVLKRAGASAVTVAVLARAEGPARR